MRSASLFIGTALLLALSVSIGDGQLFSSSGLVFPGPPGQVPRRSSKPTAGDAEAPAGPQQRQQGPPSRPNGQPQRAALPVPLSLIGQQPEEFVAAAQRRQQQQQAAAAARRAAAQQQEAEEAEEREAEEREAEEPAPRQQPERPALVSQRRQEQQEAQRPEPSINQAHQPQRRPNYPADYKPPPQQGNVVEDGRPQRRPPQPGAQQRPAEEEEEEEEEEVKPDKLQILLQKTGFNCADKKDGYYADEEVDCEIFHYCQDRTRHSWLCPEGATFHQVHLLCMPAGKENICEKSSKYHFVNDYLYKTVDNEDGTNASSGIYADRYYPDGYEQGVPFDFESDEPEDRPNYQPFNRRQHQQHHQQPLQQRKRVQQPRPDGIDNRRSGEVRRPGPGQRPPQFHQLDDEEEDSLPFSIPAFRGSQDAFDRRGRPQPQEDVNEEDDE